MSTLLLLGLTDFVVGMVTGAAAMSAYMKARAKKVVDEAESPKL